MAISIVVGDFGAGKSSMLKTRFLNRSKKEKLVYALMKKDMPDYPYESDFRTYVKKSVRMANSLFVIDEASTCMPTEQPDVHKKGEAGIFNRNLLEWFLNARKCNNMVFIVYHAIEEIPKWLVKYCDYFIRFRTNDMLQYQINRFRSFPNIVKSLKEIPTMENFEYDEIKIRD